MTTFQDDDISSSELGFTASSKSDFIPEDYVNSPSSDTETYLKKLNEFSGEVAIERARKFKNVQQVGSCKNKATAFERAPEEFDAIEVRRLEIDNQRVLNEADRFKIETDKTKEVRIVEIRELNKNLKILIEKLSTEMARTLSCIDCEQDCAHYHLGYFQQHKKNRFTKRRNKSPEKSMQLDKMKDNLKTTALPASSRIQDHTGMLKEYDTI
ncbi:unnamed protein product [Pieris macdunnoughi]|uniref:Uncharacterized protein n=1 Tax=Pieris macdunnoughi TaxID=345717 RepID=A0A821UI99_9NEOP|nr:unnamed protein product [Pieris macdunnoughi]